MITDTQDWANSRYYFEVIDRIFKSPIASQVFMEKLGYKYIIEGYLNISKTAQYYIVNEKYFSSNEYVDEFIKQKTHYLELLTPNENDLNDKSIYDEKLNELFNSGLNGIGHITQSLKMYDHELLKNQFDISYYVQAIFNLSLER